MAYITRFLGEALASYIATAVFTNGNVFHETREKIKEKTPALAKGDPPRHLVDCRMCSGAYISAATVIISEPSIIKKPKTFVKRWLAVYGLSYFLATQER